jgi:hypothetical protein
VTNDAEAALPPAPPGYVWAQSSPQPPPWKAPLWLKVLTGIWVAVLLAGGLYYSFHGKATVRGQTTITQAQPVVDRAIADVVSASGSGPVVALSGFNRIGTCSVTPVRSGFTYQRTVTLYAAPGSESSLLTALALRLPSRYHAKSSTAPVASLYADAGDFVAVIGAEKSPGQVLVRATTGCRAMGGQPTSVGPPSAPSANIASVLSALGVHASGLARTQVVCGNGRILVTDTATVPPSEVPGPLSDAASRLSTSPAISTDNLFAYRSGKSDVVAVESAGGLTISSTTRC